MRGAGSSRVPRRVTRPRSRLVSARRSARRRPKLPTPTERRARLLPAISLPIRPLASSPTRQARRAFGRPSRELLPHPPCGSPPRPARRQRDTGRTGAARGGSASRRSRAATAARRPPPAGTIHAWRTPAPVSDDLRRLIAPDPPFGEAEHGREVPIEDLREPIRLRQRGRDHRRIAVSRHHHLLSADRTGKFHIRRPRPMRRAVLHAHRVVARVDVQDRPGHRRGQRR